MVGVDQNRNHNPTSVVTKHRLPEFAPKSQSSAPKVFLSAHAMTQFTHAKQMYLASVTTHKVNNSQTSHKNYVNRRCARVIVSRRWTRRIRRNRDTMERGPCHVSLVQFLREKLNFCTAKCRFCVTKLTELMRVRKTKERTTTKHMHSLSEVCQHWIPLILTAQEAERRNLPSTDRDLTISLGCVHTDIQPSCCTEPQFKQDFQCQKGIEDH